MSHPADDPLLVSARREALVCTAIWLAAGIYTITYCTLYGYHRTLESLTFVLGFPDWIFWGIVAPWGVCTVVSGIFCMFFMTDEPLEDEPPADLRV